jgi:hypothetical protein
MASFVERAGQIVRTIQRLAELRKANEEATLLAESSPRLIPTGSDDNGEVDFYTLVLEIPIEIYAAVEVRRRRLESSILERVQDLTRAEGGVAVTEVVIAPRMAEPDPAPTDDGELAGPVPAFWQPGHFRLFLSHPSQIKGSVHKVKSQLIQYSVAAFVAHDDIEPTREWQAEIESALRTMDALAAFITPDFVASRWCDQEVGIAIGRDKLVVPIRVGADPHGFLGKHQGLDAKGSSAAVVAKALFEILARHPSSSSRVADSLIDRLGAAYSWDSAKATTSLLEVVPQFSSSQAVRMVGILDENDQVSDAFGVPERIHAMASGAL